MMKRLYSALYLSLLSLAAVAQSGTHSPYSQYGWGLHSDQTGGFNRGMNGVGVGFREHNQVNFINPASYSAMDSTMFLFDVGVSGQISNFKENGVRLNAKNANFEYAVAGLRLFKNVGLSFGLIPFTNVGYNYATTGNIGDTNGTTFTNTYKGSGGLHQMYVGMGWQFVKGLSAGVNASYIWGGFERSAVNSYSDTYINTVSKFYEIDVADYKVDFGLQYAAQVTKKDQLIIGLTYGLGHSINDKPESKFISINPQTAIADTTIYAFNGTMKLPHTFGAGISWNHRDRWKVGVDYTLQKYRDVGFPEFRYINGQPQYVLNNDYFKDRQKINIGGRYCKDERGRKFFDRIQYRAGVSYTDSYYKVNGTDGPKELSVSAGFGIPIANSYNNRSFLNISAQWVRQSAPGLLTDNTFRINIGLTFNERWFQKWKFE